MPVLDDGYDESVFTFTGDFKLSDRRDKSLLNSS